MTITSQHVAALSPEAFACIATSPFCGAPAYSRNVRVSVSQQEIVRCPLCPLRVLTHVEKRSYGKHGRVFTRGPAPQRPDRTLADVAMGM